MEQEPDKNEHHRQRSEFIRALVQRHLGEHAVNDRYRTRTPQTIVQYWHDLSQLPDDIAECVASWRCWQAKGFTHRLFDETNARSFIASSLGARFVSAFDRCYHPAMQADYFRLCYLRVEGGFYVDADDVCVGDNLEWLFQDGRLKLQPLCYDIESGRMVQPSVFLSPNSYDASWIFYFNNNPLVASQSHPIIASALDQATTRLESADEGSFPEIQMTTGPGNLSKSIFDLGMTEGQIDQGLVVLRDWESFAVSRWPLSHRNDARNWRLSNQERFNQMGGLSPDEPF